MQWFWDNVYLSRDERDRFIFVLYLLGFFIIVNFAMVRFYKPPPPQVDSETLASIKMISVDQNRYTNAKSRTDDNSNTPKSINSKKAKKSKAQHQRLALQTFSFDPNTLGKDSLLMLGLSNYSVNSLLKYREKGGKIWKPEQMSKINGIDEATLERILPLIRMPKKNYELKPSSPQKQFAANKPNFEKKKYKKKIPKIIEINTADTTDFMNLYGIGTTYSNRIINYRNYLGGFISIDQVGNVWGISDSLYQTLVPFLTVDPSKIKKRNINMMSKEELEKHPYINWKKSKHILAYKKAHGDYSDIEDLYKLHGLKKEFVDTLKLYFDVK